MTMLFDHVVESLRAAPARKRKAMLHKHARLVRRGMEDLGPLHQCPPHVAVGPWARGQGLRRTDPALLVPGAAARHT